MNLSELTDATKRYETAPDSHPLSPYSSAVIGVTFSQDEYVDWHWTYYPDGSRVVTGYTIRKQKRNEIT